VFGKTNWVLKGVRGAHAHAIFVLEANVILGRSADADIQILDQRVSRQHARLVVTSDEVLLEDLGSHNGTYLHGHKVARRPLRVGDRIRVGVSEYVLDRIKGRILTSAIFLNKLTNKDTMGATAVSKRATREILTSETAEMPKARITQEISARLDDPGSLPPRPSRARPEPEPEPPPAAPKPRFEPVASASELPQDEPAYLREQRERAVRLPTPLPGELDWGGEKPEATLPDSTALLPEDAGAPLVRHPTPNPFVRDALEAETVPLDPRSQRIPTPLPASVPPLPSRRPLARPAAPELEPAPRAHAERHDEHDEAHGLEAALRTIDAVVRLLKLRAQESGGALLKIQDREALRRLEGALRESRRNRNNRRRWSRLPCRLAAHVGDQDVEARVTDIGAGGLRVTGGFQVAPGDLVNVRVHLGEGPLTRIAVFQTKVAWVDAKSSTFGAIFAGPAHWELAS